MAKSISAQQRKFANEWIRTHNAYQSAIYAGYALATAKNATHQLLENAGISKYISSKTKKVEQKESDEADEVLKNIYRIASGRSINHDFVKIDNLKKEHKKAKHFPYAYKFNTIAKKTDDKEPSGTTRGLLDLIHYKNLDNTLIVVIRYFGGTLLGAGPLTRTYTKVVSMLV